MRCLFPSLLATFTLGVAMIGCNQSSSPDPAPDGSGKGVDAPHQATFHVPGMS